MRRSLPQTCAHVWYTGRVQGVGFRATAEEAARRHKVTGWVCNLRDGRVELRAQGAEPQLVRFLEDLRTGPMGRFIAEVCVEWSESAESCKHFEIRY